MDVLNHKKMGDTRTNTLKDGDKCKVISGVHTGKSGTVRDINTSKSGQITITVDQNNGIRFKILGKNVIVIDIK